MTRRATFTQAELSRAIAAAEARGKVAVWTAAGVAFLAPDVVPAPSMITGPAEHDGEEGNPWDAAFG